MATTKQLNKSHVDWLVDIEEQMQELADKTNMVDVVAGWLDELPIQELMYRVDNLKEKATKTGGLSLP